MSAPRVIPIERCKLCPHAHDWSSGGLECEHPGRRHGNDRPGGRTIVGGYGSRMVPIPSWCPLPLATTLTYPQNSAFPSEDKS